jgi:hypothetical protein
MAQMEGDKTMLLACLVQLILRERVSKFSEVGKPITQEDK